jgi:hypothetical protein
MKKFLLFVFLLLFLTPCFVLGQGNYNEENFGNRSILLSGNVTGSVEDLGLTYYNPARIALIENLDFTINAKAYQANSVIIKNVFGKDNKLSDSDFRGIPSLVSGTFKLKNLENHHFAYTFLTKQRSNLGLNLSRDLTSENISDNINKSVSNFNLRNKETDEWFGISWGTKLKENFSIGVSTFFSIYNDNGTYDLLLSALDDIQDVDLFYNEIKFGQKSYGIFTKVGLAWNVDKFELGLNIDLPYLEIVNSGKFRYQKFLSGNENDKGIFQYYDYTDLKSTRKEPLGISFGVGLPLGKNKIHFKTDWHGKIAEYDRIIVPIEENSNKNFTLKEELKSVINIGIGAEIYLNSQLNIYGSFSTDFSPLISNNNIIELLETENNEQYFDADYYHYGFGFDFKLKKMQLILGTTYSSASEKFSNPVELPIPAHLDATANDNITNIIYTRWRFIIGLEIPIFGSNIKFN